MPSLYMRSPEALCTAKMESQEMEADALGERIAELSLASRALDSKKQKGTSLEVMKLRGWTNVQDAKLRAAAEEMERAP